MPEALFSRPRESQHTMSTSPKSPKKKPEDLRSQQWFGRQDRDGFAYRSWVKGKGVPHDQFDGRPVIGICNTFSELTPCNSHFRTLAEQVKIGVYEAGGFPLEFPVMSLGETLLRPTAMLYRNLASMDVEESIRGNPIDGVVLLMGCDKTTPALLMGAGSANLPTIGVSGGPMLNGKWRGQELGSGTGVWSMSEQVRAGRLKLADFFEAESCMHRSHGHCMTMGTASTMASMVEALGIGLPGNAAYPAVDGRRNVLARSAGRRIVQMVHDDQKIGDVLTRQAFENAIKTLAAIGGSTNAVIHLIAIAGRLGVPLSIDDFDQLASTLPCLVNLQPSGQYLMEDFCYAGGLPAVMKEIAQHLHLDIVTASGQTVRENFADAQNYNPQVIKTLAEPFKQNAGIAILRGNLAPRGAVIKPSAATPALMQHTGRAVVFKDSDDFHARIDDDTLDIDETCIMVLKNCGPKGYPGMAEVGNMPLPPKVLKKGITDMVHEDQVLSKVLTRQAFENAIKTLAAIGGSTNAVIHLIAIARRIGVELAIEDFDRLASELPCLVNLQPSGKFLMEDFCYAGGLPVVMKEISKHLHLDAVTANGLTVGENIADAQNYNTEVILPLERPFKDKAGIAVLRGNLAPRGAVIKPSAATPALMVHKGRAVVFENIEDFHARIDDENLDVDETCILVLKNCGPKGYPGMAEVGNMPLPPKVLRKGITDMVRISDARMSGTAYGTVVLHTAPEAAAGGPLAVVRNGDIIELDVPKRKLQLHISDEELARRLSTWQAPPPPLSSGYWKLYVDHVLQADEGVDLDFLVGKRGAFVPRDNH